MSSERCGFAFNECLCTEALSINLGYTVVNEGGVLLHEKCVGRQELEEADTAIVGGGNERHDSDGVHTLHRELCLYIEGANAVELDTEEVETVRMLAGVRENVDDATADGKLAWLVDVVNMLEAEGEKLTLESGKVIGLPYPKGLHLSLQTGAGDSFDREGLGVSDYKSCRVRIDN